MKKIHKYLTSSWYLLLSACFVYSSAYSADDLKTEEVIVTGTAVSRSALDLPLAVTTLDEKELQRFSASSQADILRTVPGVSAEGGGGEVATNLRVRGLPTGGQFEYTPLQYDGIPIFNTFGLNSSAFDVFFRTDMGIDRLEFVRGGVSNLFGSSSVAGVINYISKNGRDNPENILQFETADEGRYRGDFYTGGRFSDTDTYYSLAGFYRTDEGPLDSGLDTEGGQLRGNIKSEFAGGELTVSGQYINDNVQFFLPLPLNNGAPGDRSRATGNDGETVYTLQTDAAAGLSYNTPLGRYTTPIKDGVSTNGGFLAVAFEKEFGDNYTFKGKTKLADYDHQFNLFLDGDGKTNSPQTGVNYLSRLYPEIFPAGAAALTTARLTNVATGQALGATDLVFGNRLLDRVRDAKEVTAEFSLSKEFTLGSATHTATAGIFYADSEAVDINYITRYVTEFNDAPDMVNITYRNADGDRVIVADNGLVSGGITSDHVISAERIAFYLTDQIETDKWIVDLGLRVERINGDISKSTTANTEFDVTGKGKAAVAPLLQSTAQLGHYNTGTVTETDVAYSFGVLHKLTDAISAYGNASFGFFFPQLRQVAFSPDGQIAPYESEAINTYELGVKYDDGRLNGAFAVFRTDLDDRAEVRFENNAAGDLVTTSRVVSTETIGVEGYASYAITDHWIVDANFLYQDHEFTEYDKAPANIGNEFSRTPNTVINYGVFYDDGKFDGGFFASYKGKTFTNDANIDVLDDYTIFRMYAGYTHAFSDDNALRLALSIFNLTDTDGLAEGSPRLGDAASGVGDFFIGRPELPRRITFTMTYDF